MMPSPRPGRDAIGVALTAAGALLVGIGGLALWVIVPLAGALLTIVAGALLASLGVRALLRSSR